MTLREDLYALLAPLFDGRVYPLAFPQSPHVPVWPAARYSIVSDVPWSAVCGSAVEATSVRLQIDVVAATYDAMVERANATRVAMQSFDPPAVLQMQAETIDHETALWRAIFDYVIGYSSQS